jgi:subtilisin family serine protease
MRKLVAILATLSVFALSAGTAAAAPNDPYWNLQWGPAQINAPQAWTTSTGAGTTIAVVDSGVDLDHPDVAGKIVGGATFFGCPTQPNGCGNGDWQSGGGTPEPHGTHVAGIAAAASNNGIGIAGVAPDAKILAVRSLDANGGSFEEIAAGVRWATDHGANVINLSLGALPGVQALVITGLISDVQDAITYARSKGVVVVAAAGNETAPLCDTPGSDGGALCVVATDKRELHAAYSNFGVKYPLDVVAAPGGAAVLSCQDDVISTVPPDAAPGSCEQSEGNPATTSTRGPRWPPPTWRASRRCSRPRVARMIRS